MRKPICLMLFLIVCAAASRAQTAAVTTLYTFPPVSSSLSVTPDGLIQASDGNFYGITAYGGISNNNCLDAMGNTCGTIFKITPNGEVTTVYSFTGGTDGFAPYGSLVEGGDGNFYGVTGIFNGISTVYKVTPSGTLTTLSNFNNGTSGNMPFGSLIPGSDGNFYGTTVYGGVQNCLSGTTGCGTIFRISPGGTLTTVYKFCATLQDGACPDGQYPQSALLEGSDGNLYGTTPDGGNLEFNCSDCNGTVFQLAPTGTFTTLYKFCTSQQENCPDGALPYAPLVEGGDGDFYGTTLVGGQADNDSGSLFKITSTGVFSSLYSFCLSSCSDGGIPVGLVLASDGNFYGTTESGTIFQMSPAGSVTTLYNFDATANVTPNVPLVQGADGNLYGTTDLGSDSATAATVFQAAISPALTPPIQLSLSSTAVEVGAPVTLTWKVTNGFSKTLQQCNAFIQNNATGAGTWTGPQTGTLTSGVYTGSAIITPTDAGFYIYALTCGGVESGFAGLRVGGAKATTSTFLRSNSPIVLGTKVILSASVSSILAMPAPTGTVIFSYGSLTLGKATLSSGSAVLNVTPQNIPSGTYNIMAAYSGDANFAPSSDSSTVAVLGYSTATTLSAPSTTLTQGQSTTFSATVARTAASGTPTGSVNFFYGTTPALLGKAVLKNGTATLTAATSGSIPAGVYAVTAAYAGDASDQPSTSADIFISVFAATKIALTVTPNPVGANQSVAISAKVTQKYGAAIPTGYVNFTVGSYFVAQQDLDGTGTAALTLSDSGIAPGTYPLTAAYSGDNTNAASSTTLTVTIN